MKSSPLPVTLFADFACPFCYVTEAALYRLRDQHQLELRARAFELVPWDAPRSPGPPEEDELRTASTFAAELGIEMLTRAVQEGKLDPSLLKALEGSQE